MEQTTQISSPKYMAKSHHAAKREKKKMNPIGSPSKGTMAKLYPMANPVRISD